MKQTLKKAALLLILFMTIFVPTRMNIAMANLNPALVPDFGMVTSTVDGFRVDVMNYDLDFTYQVDVDGMGFAELDSQSGSVIVRGLAPDDTAVLTVTTYRDGYETGSNQIAGNSLRVGLDSIFGTPIATVDGFTVSVMNYDPSYTYQVDVDAGVAELNTQSESIIVTGLALDETAVVTVTTIRDGYAPGTSQVTGNSLRAALTPAFGPSTSTADGFTVAMMNYDPSFTYDAHVDGSAVAEIDALTGSVIVYGLAPDETTSVTVTTTRDGYAPGTNQVTGSSLRAALTPAFGPPTSTADGFTADVLNYDQSFIFDANVDSGTVHLDAQSGKLTVSGIAPDATAVVTVTTIREGYAPGSNQIEGSSLRPGLTPAFGTPTPKANGFTVALTNYDPAYTYEVTSNAGDVVFDDGSGLITVTNLSEGESANVTVHASRNLEVGSSSEVTGTSLFGGLLPKFVLVTRATAGFSVPISNYDANFIWIAQSTLGTATISHTGLLTVTGLAAGQSATVTVRTERAGYGSASSTVVGAANPPTAVKPTFAPVVKKANGFTVQIKSYNKAYTYKATTTAGKVVISKTGMITVTGLRAGESAKVTVTTTRSGYSSNKATVTGSANLGPAWKAKFAAVTTTSGGFKIQLKNYNKAYTWKVKVSGGKVKISSSGLITVTGLKKGATATVTVTTTRTGYTAATATIKGKAK